MYGVLYLKEKPTGTSLKSQYRLWVIEHEWSVGERLEGQV
jgi:hypothetical protein